jgi:hypothetical protein
MKKLAYLSLLLPLLFAACNQSDNVTPEKEAADIILKDSSDFNGRLFVYTYDFNTNNRLSADVYIFTRYEDISRNLFLYYKRTQNTNAEADFGFLLQGNYYIVASTFNKSDTSLVQVLSKREIRRNLYLQ